MTDGVTCLMDHSPCVGSPLAAAAHAAADDQDEDHQSTHRHCDVPPTKVVVGGIPIYRGGGEHEQICKLLTGLDHVY